MVASWEGRGEEEGLGMASTHQHCLKPVNIPRCKVHELLIVKTVHIYTVIHN